ncbi:TR112 protein, partial [Eubucco bourcierii]|nr:TR112 protein [Eubucco bourcierii]
MKLLTHNMLTSHVRGLKPRGGFPLHIQKENLGQSWGGKLGGSVHFVPSLPPLQCNFAFLLSLPAPVGHQVEVLEGELRCPASGRRFPISRGIPNMLLSEEEA